MVDTIALTLKSSTVNYPIDFMAEVGSKINVDFKKSNEYRIIGTLKNLNIYIEPSYIRIEGSLPKYYYGTNLITLSRTEPGIIIDQLSTKLGIPLQEATITRIDIGANIEVDNYPRSYFPSLGILSKFDRVPRKGSTLYYEQGWCKLCLYDKIAEAKIHNDPYLTDELLTKNILRYEIRYFREYLKHRFKRNIKAKEIYGNASDVCCELIAEWYFKYEAITKIGIMKPKFDMTMKSLIGWYLKDLSRKQNILRLIDSCSEKGDRRAARLKREVIKMLKEQDSVPENLVEEFNSKVFEWVDILY